MLIKVLVLFLSLVLATEAIAAEEYHFKVTNKSSAKIVKIQTSPDKKNWGDFDIGGGIKIGNTVTLVWDESTNDQPCVQWIRAKFSDGGWSTPSKENFCEDMENPIVFTD